MPLYEYECDCGEKAETLLPMREYNQPQFCKCGEVMRRKMSLSRFVIDHDGNERALGFLNSPEGEFPHAHTPQHRREFQQGVFAGTQKPPKTLW